jgi:hypothetical protein
MEQLRQGEPAEAVFHAVEEPASLFVNHRGQGAGDRRDFKRNRLPDGRGYPSRAISPIDRTGQPNGDKPNGHRQPGQATGTGNPIETGWQPNDLFRFV